MKIEEIRELAKIVSENGLESIEFQDGQCNLKITRPVAVAVEPYGGHLLCRCIP